jgi:hypothetical protein
VKPPQDPPGGGDSRSQSQADSPSELEMFRAQELLLLRATEGLTAAQAAELEALGAADDDSYDLAAAAIELATLPHQELPFEVAQRVLLAAGARPPSATIAARNAGAGAASSATSGAGSAAPPASPEVAEAQASPQGPRGGGDVLPLAPRRSRIPLITSCIATAAAAAAIVWAVRKPPERVIERVVERVEIPAPPPATPSPTEARAQLLASAADVQTLPWTATADPAAKGARGDVVWSPSKQEGYLRFVGLAPNDPTLIQYQLWIFDQLRDERYPVDGGVFDAVAAGPDGEVVIKISPKLFVNQPVLFAITVEPPGGVVVSKRERIVVTAAPAKAG